LATLRTIASKTGRASAPSGRFSSKRTRIPLVVRSMTIEINEVLSRVKRAMSSSPSRTVRLLIAANPTMPWLARTKRWPTKSPSAGWPVSA